MFRTCQTINGGSLKITSAVPDFLFLTIVAVVIVVVDDNDEDRGIYMDKEGAIVYAD